MEIAREIGEKGQVVIPIDIRRMLSLNSKSKVIFKIENNEVKIRAQESSGEFFKRFLKHKRKGNSLAVSEIKKIEDESYDLS